VLRWASASDVEAVKVLWRYLCKAVRQPETAPSERVASELSEYGGNSIANFFRSKGVPYEEVAGDVAKALRGFVEKMTFQEAPFDKNNLESCERFVLEKMKVSQEDLRALCDAVKSRGEEEAREAAGAGGVAKAALRTVGGQVGVRVAAFAGERAAQRVAAESAKQVGKRAAKAAAQKAGAEVSKQVLTRIVTGVNVVLTAWAVVDLAGPALRVTIPAVTFVALLRQQYISAAMGIHPRGSV